MRFIIKTSIKTLPIFLRFVSGSLTPASSDKKRSPESTFYIQAHSFVLIQNVLKLVLRSKPLFTKYSIIFTDSLV
jgi:hypothetical protein